MAVNLVGGTTSASAALAFNAQTGTTYALVAADAENKLVTCSNASAITVTVPPSVFTRAQNSACTVICTASNTFLIVGDLA